MSHTILSSECGVVNNKKGKTNIRITSKSVLLFFALPIVSAVIACVIAVSPAHAAQTAPYRMNFQGRLTNVSGVALTGNYDMQFRFYNDAVKTTFIWGETRTAANGNAMTVTNGLFSLLIGGGTSVSGTQASLQAAVTNYPAMFLEVTVGGVALTPLSEVGSSVYSINSDMLDGLDATAFAPASGSTNYAPISGSTNYAPISGSANYIQNGSSQQATSNFNISGNGTIGGVGTVTGNFTNNGAALFSNTANSASAFTIQGTSSVKLFVADTSASRIYIGDPVANATGIVLVLDNSTAEPTGVDGAMYYNTTTKSFRCYKNVLWGDCNFASLRSEWVVQEEFANISTTTLSTGTQGWTGATIGATGTATKLSVGANASNYDRFGVIQLASAATTINTGWNLRLDTTGMTGVPANMTVEFDFAPVSANAAAGTNQTAYIGLHNGIANTTAPTDGFYFRYLATTAAGNWERCVQAVCASTGVARTLTAQQYQRFKIQTNATGTSVEFFINEVSVGTVSSGLPTQAAADVYGPSISVIASNAAPASVMQWKMDYYQIKRNLTTLR